MSMSCCCFGQKKIIYSVLNDIKRRPLDIDIVSTHVEERDENFQRIL